MIKNINNMSDYYRKTKNKIRQKVGKVVILKNNLYQKSSLSNNHSRSMSNNFLLSIFRIEGTFVPQAQIGKYKCIIMIYNLSTFDNM